MISQAEEKLLDFLLDHLHESFSFYSLAKNTGLSHTWIYQLAEKLKNEQFLLIKDRKIQIDLTEEKTISLKLYRDREKVASSPAAKKITFFADKIKELYGKDLLSLCLIGSAVSQKKPEDIDLLIITETSHRPQLEVFAPYEDLNLIEIKKEEFKEKYLATDDFIVCSLASQRILFDRDFIIRFIQRPFPFPNREIIRERIEQLLKLKERLLISLTINDKKNIKENLTALVIQLIRLQLLKAGILPLSKTELPTQIKKVDKKLYADFTTIIKKEVPFFQTKKLAETYAKQNFRSLWIG